MAALALVAAAGCKPERALTLRYLPGFVPGSEHLFHPASIGVLQASGRLAIGTVRVGGVYSPDGSLEESLVIQDAGTVVTVAVIKALSDSGLRPFLAGPMQDGAASLRVGTDYLLTTTIEEISVAKHFGTAETVHGQYFAMDARVRIKFNLSSRSDPNVYSGEMTGTEEEPPSPVGHEIFLPLETDPSEALSVALSRAVGALMLQPGFRQGLPQLIGATPSATANAAPTSSATPSR